MKLLRGLLAALLLGGFAGRAGAAQARTEYELLRSLPNPVLAGIITNTGLPDAQGFIGFHQSSHQWYEAGMQRGGCWILIGAVVAGDEQRADTAWKSIETTFEHQSEDGGFISNRKPDATHAPTRDERVETAYFYLQELGHALLVLRDSPMEPHFHDRIAALEPKIRRACAFIQAGYGGIIPKVGHTANRLLIAAKAFGLCGVFLKDQQLQATSRKLIAAALARRDAEGVFVERSGRDSSYNAVSLLMGQVLLLYLPEENLEAAMKAAMAWQRTRIKPNGEVDVSGNTRTGVGLEAFMGRPKGVNYHEVALALMYYGTIRNDPGALELAQKVATGPRTGG